MAAEVGRAWVAILPSAKGFSSSLHKQVVPASETAGKNSGRRFGDFYAKTAMGPLRALGVAAAGIFAVDKVGEFFKTSIAEARESQIVSARTAAVIKSTGGVANVSAKQIGDLATAISNKVGIDDEAIQSSENLLLTFKNVRNEAGAGNDVFNQATQAVTDMSAAMDQSAKASAVQLGKALNDPIKGLTALSRVGVTFDAGQVKQIKTLVAHGNALKAQKIILGELNSEFAGAAAASTTTGQKVSVAFKNIEESVGRALLPALDALERSILTGVFPALRTAATYFKTTVVPVMAQFGRFVTTSIIPAVTRLADRIGPALVSAADAAFSFFTTNVLPVLRQVAQFIVDKVVPAVGSLLVSALGDLKSAFHTISAAVQSHRAQLTELLHGFRAVAGFALRVLVPVLRSDLKTTFQAVGIAFTVLVDLISAGVTVFNKLRTAVMAVGRFFGGPFLRVMGAMVQVVVRSFQFMADAAIGFIETFTHSASKAFGWVPLVGGKLKDADKAVSNFRSGVDSTLSGMAVTASKWGHSIGTNIDNGIIGGLNAKQQEVYSAARGIGTAALTGTTGRLKIQSPSKVFQWIGEMTVAGLVKGINSGRRSIEHSITMITNHISELPKQAQTWWKAIAAAGTRELNGLTNRLDHVSSAFQKTAAAAKQMTQDIKASLTQNTGLANIDMSTVTSPGGLVAGFDTQLRDLKTFVHDLHLLRKKGLSKSLYNQLLAMGPTAGLPIAADLLADPSTIAQLNRDQARVDSISSSFAQNATQAKYGKTLDHQLKELRGLRQDMREERRVLGTLGRQVVNAEHKIEREKRQKERTKTGGSTTTKSAGS